MRIGIDASWACGQRTGTGSYTFTLIRSLLAADHTNRYVLYFRSCCREGNPVFGIQQPNVTQKVVDSSSTLLRSTFLMSSAIARDHLDVYVSPAFLLPIARKTLYVSVFYDLNVFLLPACWMRKGTAFGWLALRFLLPLALNRADRVVAISAATRNDIAARFPKAARKLTAIHCPFDPSRFAVSGADEARAERPAGKPWFLYVGVMSPTKNLERLLAAFQIFKQSDSAGFSLVLAGRDCGDYRRRVLEPLVERLGLKEEVVWRDFVDDAELARLYKGARALVFPSLIEGFGYPIVEAMYFGTPVLTSATSSCPEIAGDAALCVDPRSVEAIANGMRQLANDETFRADLIARGKNRWRAFSPESIAAQWIELLNNVVGQKQAG
jgi:glycosyltransferase involved in cell wall biosynthesis